MTVSTEISSNEYTGNGLTTDFDYKFRIFKANQLSVITSDADGDNVVTLRLGTDYTVTGANKSAGGKVILTRPLANGHKISIARDIPITQETSFRNQSKFFAETHEDAFDYLTMLMQRVWGSLSLFLKRPTVLANWFDAKGYRISNLGKPKKDSDAVDLGTMKGAITTSINCSLRVDDMDIAALPKATERRNKQIGFDNSGIPTLLDPAETGALGYILVDSFEKGALITSRYQALHFEYQGEFYRWDGDLPKPVPSGSTPQSTGGVAVGRWVSTGNAHALSALREHELSSVAHEQLFTSVNEKIKSAETKAVDDLVAHNADARSHPELKSYLSTEVERIDNALNDFMQIQMGSGRIFATIQDGLSNTVNGQRFLVQGTSPSFADMYLNNSGSANFINSMSDISAVQGMNIFPDPTFNILKLNNGYLNGKYVFEAMPSAPIFPNTNSLGLQTNSVMRVESGAISIRLKKDDMVLIGGKRLFFKSFFTSDKRVTFSVYFRNGSEVVSEGIIRTTSSLINEAVVSLDVPASASYDTLEIRYLADDQSYIEVGYLLCGYNAAPNSVVVSEFENKKTPINILYDSVNEISSKTPKTIVHNYYETAGDITPIFSNDPNNYCSSNAVYTKTNRVNKVYDIKRIKFDIGDKIHFACKAYSTGAAAVHIQFYKADGSLLQTKHSDLSYGNNQVIITDTLLSDDVTKFKVAIIPQAEVGIYVNDFYLGFEDGLMADSAVVPEYMLASNKSVLPPNTVPDQSNQLSLSSVGNKWFSGKYTLLNIGEAGLKNVARISGSGRLTKSYDISEMGLKSGDVVTVGAVTYLNKDSVSKSQIYAQFRNSTGSVSQVQKSAVEGVDKTLMQVEITGAVTELRFIIDIFDDAVFVDITDFYLGVNNPRGGSGQLPVSILNSLISGAGNSNQLPQINNNALINYHLKSAKLALAESAQISMAFIGDSWTHKAERYSGGLTSILSKLLGDSGSGWIGFGVLNNDLVNGNARPSLYSLTYSDVTKWNLSTSAYYKSYSPDLCAASSNIAGAKLSVSGKDGIKFAKLMYMKTSGQFKYRFGSNEWVVVDASTGNDLNVISPVGLPTTNNWTFELEVVSGVVTVCGMDTRNSETWNGIVTHKLGATGSHSRHWVEVPEAPFVNAIKALKLDSVFILLGTNDQAVLSPDEFESNLRILIHRLQKADSAIDIVLVCPCENLRSNVIPMSMYSQKMREIANSIGVGFIDLQTVFGVSPQSYGVNADRPLFSVDGIHPEPLTGGRAIVSAMKRFIES